MNVLCLGIRKELFGLQMAKEQVKDGWSIRKGHKRRDASIVKRYLTRTFRQNFSHSENKISFVEYCIQLYAPPFFVYGE